MYRWYVINTYSGHENKVKHNLEHRVQTMSQNRNVRQVVVPTEQVMELGKDGQKQPKEKRTMPGYVLVNMEMTDDAWSLVKNTPGVTGFVGAERNKPVPLSKPEVDRLLDQHRGRRRLGDEGEGAVLVDRDFDRDDRPAFALRLGVEGFAEIHDVDAVLAQRGADRRRRVGVACLDLQLDDGEDFFGHEGFRRVAGSAL